MSPLVCDRELWLKERERERERERKREKEREKDTPMMIDVGLSARVKKLFLKMAFKTFLTWRLSLDLFFKFVLDLDSCLLKNSSKLFNAAAEKEKDPVIKVTRLGDFLPSTRQKLLSFSAILKNNTVR